jgi:hypothetical protein
MKMFLILAAIALNLTSVQAQTVQSPYLFRAKEQAPKGWKIRKLQCTQAIKECIDDDLALMHRHQDGYPEDTTAKVSSLIPAVRGQAYISKLAKLKFNTEFTRISMLGSLQSTFFMGTAYCAFEQDAWEEPESFLGVALLDKTTKEMLLIYQAY